MAYYYGGCGPLLTVPMQKLNVPKPSARLLEYEGVEDIKKPKRSDSDEPPHATCSTKFLIKLLYLKAETILFKVSLVKKYNRVLPLHGITSQSLKKFDFSFVLFVLQLFVCLTDEQIFWGSSPFCASGKKVILNNLSYLLGLTVIFFSEL